MSEVGQADTRTTRPMDGLSKLLDPEFIKTQLAIERSVIQPYSYSRTIHENGETRLQSLYGNENIGQRVTVTGFVYPSRTSQRELPSGKPAAMPANYSKKISFTNTGSVLTGVELPLIEGRHQAALALQTLVEPLDREVTRYYMRFEDVIDLGLVDRQVDDVPSVGELLQGIYDDSQSAFEDPSFRTLPGSEKRQTISRMERDMSRRIGHLIHNRVSLFVNAPTYFSELRRGEETPNMDDETLYTLSSMLAGRALRVTMKMDDEPPFQRKPYLVIRNDHETTNYAIPIDALDTQKDIEAFD